MARKIRTIEDIEREFYWNPLENLGIGQEDFAKDAPVITTTTGAMNVVYGAKLWDELCTEYNIFAALPKKPYQKGGYRLITAAGNSTGRGIDESAAIPATTKPTFAEINVPAKEVSVSFDMSKKQLALQGKNDVVTWDELKAYTETEFKKCANVPLLSTSGTTAGYNFESIDRVCASHSEDTSCTDAAGNAFDENDNDIYLLDRDSTSTYDAYVGHNSGTDRTFTMSLVDTLLDNIRPYWKSRANKVIITGYDTFSRMNQEMGNQLRYDSRNITFDVNGVQVTGKETGFMAAMYQDIPILTSNDVVKDTISRLYVLDLDRIEMGILEPVQYFESEDYQAIDKFAREGVYYMSGELVATGFHCHGKLRDLK